ncbi:hypothetical protein [Burkholderia semiarida]|uniref:hypothetical protein n=1 Tax=Burkholderia semiarida TaxID=2843303 RepID=UPI003877FB8E
MPDRHGRRRHPVARHPDDGVAHAPPVGTTITPADAAFSATGAMFRLPPAWK